MLDLLKLDVAEREITEHFPIPIMYRYILGLYGEIEKGSVCCPFHGERTPSFSYTPGVGNGIWKCFGECDRGGDTIELYRFYIEKKQGRVISRVSAIQQLVSLPEIKNKLSVKDLLSKPKEFKSFEEYLFTTIKDDNKRIKDNIVQTNLLIKEIEKESDIDVFICKYDKLLKERWQEVEE